MFNRCPQTSRPGVLFTSGNCQEAVFWPTLLRELGTDAHLILIKDLNMAFEHAFFDEQGQRAVGVALTTLQALAPLTSDPTATLAAMGITDPTLEAALIKIAELAASDT